MGRTRQIRLCQPTGHPVLAEAGRFVRRVGANNCCSCGGMEVFEWFRVTPDGKQVFLLGSISNEPAPGLWRCDLASGDWREVRSSSDYPSPDARAVVTTHGTLTVPGGQVGYTLFRPAHFDRHKKHPMLIGDTAIDTSIYTEPFMTGVAACGAVVAVVDRPNWTPGLDQWTQNTLALYAKMKGDPTVDTRRVFVFAVSAETYYCSQMLETNPAPWRGVILLNPGQSARFFPITPVATDAQNAAGRRRRAT